MATVDDHLADLDAPAEADQADQADQAADLAGDAAPPAPRGRGSSVRGPGGRWAPRAAAPRTTAQGNRAGRGGRDRRPRPVPLSGRIAGLYTTCGLAASLAPNHTAQAVGVQLVAQAATCGKAWETCAKENPAIRRALEQVLTVSSIGALITAHLPIVLAALAAGGKLDASLLASVGAMSQPPPQPPADPWAMDG